MPAARQAAGRAAGCGTALRRGDGHRGRREPCRGTRHRDSPESHDTGAAGPEEDKGFGVLAFLLLLGSIAGCPLRAAEHLQRGQGQAELRAQGAATSAERSDRERAGGGRAQWLPWSLCLRPWVHPAAGCRGAQGCPLGAPAPRPGPGLGRKGSWALPALLGLGDDEGVPEEEEVPLARPPALGHPHMLALQRLGCCSGRQALLPGLRVIPVEQTASGMMSKAAAAGPGCAGVSPSHGGSSPGAVAAVHLSHLDEGRGILRWDTAVGLRTVPSWSA